MNNPKVTQALINLGRALQRLEEATQVAGHNALKVDGTIQRFDRIHDIYLAELQKLYAFLKGR